MPIRLNSTGGGAVSIDVPSTASTFTLTAPARTGNIITSADSGTVTGTMIAAGTVTTSNLVQPLTSMTVQNSTSGTFIDFTGIPSWARRITVMFNGVSTNGTSDILLRLGNSGGIETTGYTSHTGYIQASSSGSNVSTAGFILIAGLAADVMSGSVTFASFGSNVWIGSGILFRDSGTDYSFIVSGSKTLSGTLDRVRITTVNGTDTFDAGTINVMYE